MVSTKVLVGTPLLIVGSVALIWTSLGGTADPFVLGLAALASVVMTVGTLLVGVSEDGRPV